MHARTSIGLVLLLALAGCMSIHGRYRICDPASGLESPGFRTRLSETGLYADASMRTLAEGVTPFEPNFELWSDGASKRRWLYLPPGGEIDKSDPDDWLFPTGTRFWKEFSRDGMRIETRLLQKLGPAPDDWLAVAYVWNEAGTEALAAPAGIVDARGTSHDVPAADQCMGCHGGRASRVLGYAAIQLAAAPGTFVESRAAGYLHANCGHCHNARRPAQSGARCYDPESDLDLARSVHGAPTAASAHALAALIIPGDGAESELVRRMIRDSPFKARMSPLATETIDTDGVALVTRWIDEGAKRAPR